MMGPEGFDDAILGIGTVSTENGDEEILVYDVQKMIKIVMDDSIDMTWDEAKEFVEFNILGIYLGEPGPAFYRWAALRPAMGTPSINKKPPLRGADSVQLTLGEKFTRTQKRLIRRSDRQGVVYQSGLITSRISLVASASGTTDKSCWIAMLRLNRSAI